MKILRNLFITIRNFSKDRAIKIVKPGNALVFESIPHRVVSITQGKRGKGGGFVRAKLKSLVTSNVFEKTFTSDEIVEEADLQKEIVSYSWFDGEHFFFMNTITFEEVKVPKSVVDNSKFMVEGQEVKLMKFGDEVIGVELPVICEYIVQSIDLSRAMGGTHAATLSSGAVIMVPLFIKEGSKIRVNTQDGIYLDRNVSSEASGV